MLASLEKGRIRELHHDFRFYYHVSYEDVPTEEAIDLIRSLGPGSRYAGAINPSLKWTLELYQMANIVDYLAVINWRLMRCPEEYTPEPIERPGDRERTEKAKAAAKRTRQIIEHTKWEAE